MVFIYATSDSHNGSPCILIPVRSTQSGKRRDYIASVGIRHFFGHIFGILCRINHPHLIPQPLDRGTCYKDRSFQCIIHFAVQPPCNGCDQPILRKYWFFTGIHQHKASGTVRILCLTGFETGLSKQRRLLVSRCPGNRNRAAQIGRICGAIDAAGRLHFRQYTFWNIQFLQDLIIPLQCIDIKEHSAGCIAVIRHMHFSLCQLPDQPGLHRSKEKFTFFCPFPGSRHMLQDPANLCR